MRALAKPLDLDLRRSLAPTADPHSGGATRYGGLRRRCGRGDPRRTGVPTPLRLPAIPDAFAEHAPQEVQPATLGLDAKGVVAAVWVAYPELAVPRAATAGDNVMMVHQTETVTW